MRSLGLLSGYRNVLQGVVIPFLCELKLRQSVIAEVVVGEGKLFLIVFLNISPNATVGLDLTVALVSVQARDPLPQQIHRYMNVHKRCACLHSVGLGTDCSLQS